MNRIICNRRIRQRRQHQTTWLFDGKRQTLKHCSIWIVIVFTLQQWGYSIAFSTLQVRPSTSRRHSHVAGQLKLNAAKADDRHAVPKHVAFICDGNSRWAEARGLPASVGHAAGADRLLHCLETLQEQGVEYCTFYGFSTENWKRSDREIRDILSVIEHTANAFKRRAVDENVRVKILGDIQDPRLPQSLQDALTLLEEETYSAAQNTEGRLTVCLAINYGGRQDILSATLKLARAIASGDVDPSEVSEDTFSRLLYTEGIPDPDFVIRTGGDQRLSNFLLWNLAYAELYFSDSLWPDLDRIELVKALDWFSSRSRRFGGRLEPSTQPRP